MNLDSLQDTTQSIKLEPWGVDLIEGFSGDITNAPWNPDKKPLTDMTIGESRCNVNLMMDYYANLNGKQQRRLHAVGAYQFISNTLPGVAKEQQLLT